MFFIYLPEDATGNYKYNKYNKYNKCNNVR